MGPDLVVVSAPSLQLFSRIRKREEPAGVQALGAEAAVEGFDEGVVRGLAGAGEVQGDAVGVGPQVKELCALIDPDGLWIAQFGAGPIHRLDDAFRPIGEPRIDHRGVPGEGVHDGQDPDLPAGRQLVVHEVHCPGLVRHGGLAAVFPQLGLHPAFGRLVPQLKPELIVDPSGLLDVDPLAFSLQQDMDPAIAIAHLRLTHRLDPGFETGLVGATGSVVIARRVHLKHPASPPDRHAPISPTPVYQLAQTHVFVLELLQPLHLRQQTVVLLLPVEVGHLTDFRPPADLSRRHAVGALLQNERLLGVCPEGRRSQNADAFMVFCSFPAREISAENSNLE